MNSIISWPKSNYVYDMLSHATRKYIHHIYPKDMDMYTKDSKLIWHKDMRIFKPKGPSTEELILKRIYDMKKIDHR